MIETQRTNRLSFGDLKDAVESAAAFRLRVKLSGIGGGSDKVVPPTYAGGVYAVEDRRIDGKVVRCTLLDSVQSQANRMEESLLNANMWRELDAQFDGNAKKDSSNLPVLAVYIEKHGWVTSLTELHRSHDARVVRAHTLKATASYKPLLTALIFGTWDSTAGEGLDSAKVPGAVFSEIIGVDTTPGGCRGLRIDPLGIRANSATVDRLTNAKDDRDVNVDEDENDKNKGPQRFGGGKPGAVEPGGVTMAYALHTWTLSLTQLRRLQFRAESQRGKDGSPNGDSGAPKGSCADGRNEAARTVLAALALYALTLRQEEGYWLRSGCELVPEGSLTLEQVGGKDGSFSLGNSGEMREILNDAIFKAKDKGLEWSRNLTIVKPRRLGFFERLRRWLCASLDSQGAILM